jgi:UPF0755 protein
MERFVKYFLTSLLLLVGLALLAIRDARQQLDLPLGITQAMSYEIPAGGNLKGALLELKARGVVPSTRMALYLQAYARISGLAGSIKAGEYELAPGMSGKDLLHLFVSGKVLLHDLRLVEGWTFAQALEAIHANSDLTHMLVAETPEELMAELGHPGLHPEGRFFPDTYHFPKGTSDAAFLRRALSAMDNALKLEWDGRAPDLPYSSPDEALIMASIIEKETGTESERELIASVFVNRLRIGMRLQTDPTVIYGLGQGFDGNLRRTDLTTDTPYNSYTRSGLPPTPICLPGRASIHAALHPANTKYLYFVARGSGAQYFSETLDSHNSAVTQYQKKPASKAQAAPPVQAGQKSKQEPAPRKKKAHASSEKK